MSLRMAASGAAAGETHFKLVGSQWRLSVRTRAGHGHRRPRRKSAGSVLASVAIGAAIGLAALAVQDRPFPGAQSEGGLEASSEIGEIGPGDRVLGDPDAPVTVVEYASLTCGHCADFHAKGFSRLRDGPVADGVAALVYRHYPLDRLSLLGALALECGPSDTFFDRLAAGFERRRAVTDASRPARAMRQAVGGGTDLDTCLADGKVRDRVLARVIQAREAGVSATPTFLVFGPNGDRRTVKGSKPKAVVEAVEDLARQ